MLITLTCIVMLSLVVRLLCWICNEQFLKIKYVLFTSQSFSKPYSSSSLCSRVRTLSPRCNYMFFTKIN